MQGSVLLLQGTEDPVVPPAQAEGMRAALDAAGTHCDLEFFEGEGHGFRRADTLTACLEAELAFYRPSTPPLGSLPGFPSRAPPCVRGFCEAMPTDSTTTIPTLSRTARPTCRLRVWGRIKRISPEAGDALLYGASALFALLTIYTSTNALYQVWGRMALLPFVFGAVASAVLAGVVRRARRRQAGARADASASTGGPG